MHALVTLAIPVNSRFVRRIEDILDGLGNPAREPYSDNLDNQKLVHFLSMTVVPATEGGPAHLVIELSADGEAGAAVKSVCAAMEEPIRQLLSYGNVEIGDEALSEFLLRHQIRVGQGWLATPGLIFDGTPGMTVVRIRREAELAARVSELLAKSPAGRTTLNTLESVRSELWRSGDWKWAFVSEPASILSRSPEITRMSVNSPQGLLLALPLLPELYMAVVTSFLWPGIVASLVALIVISNFGNLSLGIFAAIAVLLIFMFLPLPIYLRLRRLEKTDIAEDIPPDAATVADIMKRENFAAQNHMAAVSILKLGQVRRLTLRFGLWIAGQLAAHFSAPSFLTNTGVIHFARWITLPKTNKLLFFSNYDGAWESYLEDFIERSAQGVTGIWSNTIGFPKTVSLFFDGATDGNRLRRWTRRQQHPTLFWYAAYPQLTLARIRINAAIRQGIANAATESEAEDWLSCFGSAPRPPQRLQITDIPAIVFGGLRRLTFARCLFIEFGTNEESIKAWVREIHKGVSYGREYGKRSGHTSALLVGFTQSGLAKQGLGNALSTFPAAYQNGSAAPWRARALGDIEENAPEKWLWGGTNSSVDAVMLLYDRDKDQLSLRADEHREKLKIHGHQMRIQVELKPVPQFGSTTEAFGFVDGISNPIICGLDRPENTLGSGDQLVEPGEFILGYPDESGLLPCSPVIPAADDPGNILQSIEKNPFRQRPRFSSPRQAGRHDIGLNGTFLVIRHLEQDPDAFEEFCAAVVEQFEPTISQTIGDSGVSPKEWVAAKLVGRWRSGESLVNQPNHPSVVATDADNEFRYGTNDAEGLRCPFGAHIRRANPRDTFDPGSAVQMNITNRHRLLRVGRSYLPQGQMNKPGILFMCLNSDIERQFEFVQQTWLLGRSFNGLQDELDPVIGSGGAHAITIPTADGPLSLRHIGDFVKVLGSGYFFVPGRKTMEFLGT